MQNQHFLTMSRLRRTYFELELVQDMIDMGRALASLSPKCQELQLEMDRRQTEVDNKRERIKIAMVEIASWN